MKYIYQLFIILVVTFVGELLHYFIPIPVPASIYGLIIMLILLCTKVVKLEHVERTSDFLIEIMPLMFIPVSYTHLSETVQFKCKEAARIIQIQRLVQIQIHGIISHL